MNKVTRDIRQLLGIDSEQALRVQALMEENGLDFSECTQGQFNKAAYDALDEIKRIAARPTGRLNASQFGMPKQPKVEQTKSALVVGLYGSEVRIADGYMSVTLHCNGSLHAKLIAQAISDGAIKMSSKAE